MERFDAEEFLRLIQLHRRSLLSCAPHGVAETTLRRESMPMTLHPSHHARTMPDKPAYLMAGSESAITYGELDRISNQGAQRSC